jgi:hypothetical protein
MPQEFESETHPLRRAADQTWNIGHDEDLSVDTANLHNAENGFQRREWIVRNLGFRRRCRRQQSRLSSVWQPDEPDVGDHSQFESQPALFTRFSQFSKSRRLSR